MGVTVRDPDHVGQLGDTPAGDVIQELAAFHGLILGRLVREHLSPRLTIRGMLMTMYDPRTNLSQQVVDEVRQHFSRYVFKTVIPRNVRLGEAPSYGRPIMAYAPTSAGARAYQSLTVEILRSDGWRIPQQKENPS